MSLTKGDLQAIGSLVDIKLEKQSERFDKKVDDQSERFDKKVDDQSERFDKKVEALVSKIDTGFNHQSQFLVRCFEDLKEVMQKTYVSRDEFDEKYNELQNEVEDLEKRLKELEGRLPAIL